MDAWIPHGRFFGRTPEPGFFGRGGLVFETRARCEFDYPMNTSEPYEECGARTRRGTTCARRPVRGRRRCHLHGGRSLSGVRHPRFKHGRFTKGDPLGVQAEAKQERWAALAGAEMEREMEAMPDHETMSVRSYLAFMRAARRRVLARFPPPECDAPAPWAIALNRVSWALHRKSASKAVEDAA